MVRVPDICFSSDWREILLLRRVETRIEVGIRQTWVTSKAKKAGIGAPCQEGQLGVEVLHDGLLLHSGRRLVRVCSYSSLSLAGEGAQRGRQVRSCFRGSGVPAARFISVASIHESEHGFCGSEPKRLVAGMESDSNSSFDSESPGEKLLWILL